jgi:hypothetical protein
LIRCARHAARLTKPYIKQIAPPEISASVSKLPPSGDDALPHLRAQQEFRHLAHQIYLLAADLIGVVQADRLLAQTAADAERLPEAVVFSPQLLR